VKIYLDNCSLQRPFDDVTQPRIALEAQAILSLVAMSKANELELVSSEVLRFEIDNLKDEQKKEFVNAFLGTPATHVILNNTIETQAAAFVSEGIKPLDALHLACAIAAEADYFCTSDDKFFRKARAIMNLGIKVTTPPQLLEELSYDNR
jgi:predicted nucleic acid-binding protein